MRGLRPKLTPHSEATLHMVGIHLSTRILSVRRTELEAFGCRTSWFVAISRPPGGTRYGSDQGPVTMPLR